MVLKNKKGKREREEPHEEEESMAVKGIEETRPETAIRTAEGIEATRPEAVTNAGEGIEGSRTSRAVTGRANTSSQGLLVEDGGIADPRPSSSMGPPAAPRGDMPPPSNKRKAMAGPACAKRKREVAKTRPHPSGHPATSGEDAKGIGNESDSSSTISDASTASAASYCSVGAASLESLAEIPLRDRPMGAKAIACVENRRLPGRPPTVGDYVGMRMARQMKKELEKEEMIERTEKKIAENILVAGDVYRRDGGSLKAIPAQELAASVEEVAKAIETASRVSKGLKWTISKHMRDAVSLMRGTMGEMGRRVMEAANQPSSGTLPDGEFRGRAERAEAEVQRLREELERTKAQQRPPTLHSLPETPTRGRSPSASLARLGGRNKRRRVTIAESSSESEGERETVARGGTSSPPSLSPPRARSLPTTDGPPEKGAEAKGVDDILALVSAMMER